MGTRFVLLAAVAAFASLLAGTQAAADMSFEDPIADQRNTVELVAPDITAVHASNDRTGVITFRVTIGNYASLPVHSTIVMLFDLDRSAATGDNGFEYAVSHRVDRAGTTSTLAERFDENQFRLVAAPSTNATSTFSGGVYTLTIPRSELSNTHGFEFGLYAAVFDADADLFDPESRPAVDDAPNAELWAYALTGLPAPRISATRLMGTPARPVAGRTFTIGAQIRRSDTGAAVTSGAVTCTARVGQATVRARGRFVGGRARCTVSVPQDARGKTLRGTITIRSAGATVKRTFSYRVV